MREVAVILFNSFETLDVFGPVEILGRLKDQFTIQFYSQHGGTILSTQNVPVITKPMSELQSSNYILLIPGGDGLKDIIRNNDYIAMLKEFTVKAEFILTVCTGSILLSKTGMLDGKRATANKRLFFWPLKESPQVRWIKKARWVKEENIYTSSGVSAGMDMTLGFVSDLFGKDIAKQQAREIEHEWHEDPAWDPFADMYK